MGNRTVERIDEIRNDKERQAQEFESIASRVLKSQSSELNERQTRRVGREVISESYQRMVQRFGEVFNADVSDFMKELNRHTASGLVANLGVRLDYNGFVTSSIR